MSESKNEVSQRNQEFNFFDPAQFETMQRVCKMFANSELVPEMYKISNTNPPDKAIANCMIAIEISSRIGASPLMVMQNMIIIYGKPSWSSKFLIATVNSCGRFDPLQYKFTDLGEITNVKYTEYEWDNSAKKKLPKEKTIKGPIHNIQCVAYTKKKGGSEVLESIPVTIEMAIQEGWYSKNGSKWKTMERLMLTYRAASFWTSAYAPELSMGIKTTEEAVDIGVTDIDYEEVLDKEVSEKANKKPMSFDESNFEDAKVEDPEKRPEPAQGKDQGNKGKSQGNSGTIEFD